MAGAGGSCVTSLCQGIKRVAGADLACGLYFYRGFITSYEIITWKFCFTKLGWLNEGTHVFV